MGRIMNLISSDIKNSLGKGKWAILFEFKNIFGNYYLGGNVVFTDEMETPPSQLICLTKWQ